MKRSCKRSQASAQDLLSSRKAWEICWQHQTRGTTTHSLPLAWSINFLLSFLLKVGFTLKSRIPYLFLYFFLSSFHAPCFPFSAPSPVSTLLSFTATHPTQLSPLPLNTLSGLAVLLHLFGLLARWLLSKVGQQKMPAISISSSSWISDITNLNK